MQNKKYLKWKVLGLTQRSCWQKFTFTACMHIPLVRMISFNLFAQVVCVSESLQYTSCMCFVKIYKLESYAVIKFFVLNGLTPKEIHPKWQKYTGILLLQLLKLLKSGQLDLNETWLHVARRWPMVKNCNHTGNYRKSAHYCVGW